MNKHLIPQIYGYAVCLVTVITLFVSVHMIVDSTFSAIKPDLGSSTPYYSCTIYPVALPTVDGTGSAAEQEESNKKCLDQVRFQAIRQITNSGIVTILAIVLFVIHWRWVGRLKEDGK